MALRVTFATYLYAKGKFLSIFLRRQKSFLQFCFTEIAGNFVSYDQAKNIFYCNTRGGTGCIQGFFCLQP